jgi:rhodanese-related sulfurtransferase
MEPEDIAERRDIAILDVRDAYERQLAGGIPGAYLCPVDQLNAESLARVLTDRTQPIAIACMSGKRSRVAVGIVAELGFEDVFELTGGLLGWRAAGLPTCEPVAASNPAGKRIALTQFPRALLACFIAEAVERNVTNPTRTYEELRAVVMRYVDEEIEAHRGFSAEAMQSVIDRTSMLARSMGFPLDIIRINVEHMRSLVEQAVESPAGVSSE